MHYGIKGQKWGVRRYQYGNGRWTEEGKERRRTGREQKHIIDNLIDNLNNNFDYGVIIDGVRYDEDMSKVDWDKYRTMPVERFAKEKIGVCWDFVNYQSYICNKNGIPNKNYMAVCQRSDDPSDILTHTFTVVNIEGKQYWIESAWYKKKGVHEINSPKDVFDVIKKNEDSYSDHPLDCDFYEYDPTGMDKNLTNNEYFDRATENLVYTTAVKHSALMHYNIGEGYGPTKTAYASKYYDPVKAHEYYEQHKQLKGRTRSASSLNDEGKEKWEYVKNQIVTEKQSRLESEKQQLASQVSSIQAEIATLRTMAGAERASKKAEIMNRIKSLRTQLQAKKQQLQAQLTNKTAEVTQEKSQKSKEIQNENKAITEYVFQMNKQASESVRLDNQQKSEAVKKQKEAKQAELNKVRESVKKGKKERQDKIEALQEKINNTTDKTEKAKLRSELKTMRNEKKEYSDKTSTELSKMSENKKEFSNKASQELTDYKSRNSTGLAAFKENNSAQGQADRNANSEELRSFKEDKSSEMSEYRAKNREEVKSATERTTAAISELRNQITSFNEKSRTKTSEETSALRTQIKSLREANAANRKMLTEEYKQIQNDEFDKIYESHAKKKK